MGRQYIGVKQLDYGKRDELKVLTNMTGEI